LGIGDWGLGLIPNPQSPIPKLLDSIINYYMNLHINFSKINQLIN